MCIRDRYKTGKKQKTGNRQEIYKKEAVNGKDNRTHLDKNEVQEKKEIREKKKLQVRNQIQHQSPMQQPSASLMCPVEKKCGACNYLSVDYDKQLKKKQQDLEQLLRPFGKVEGIIGMENPYHYRHKAVSYTHLDGYKRQRYSSKSTGRKQCKDY